MDTSLEEINGLFQKMANIDQKNAERIKRIQKEYNATKNSPDFFKRRAMEKLKNIVMINPTYEEFVSYINANLHEFSQEELIEIGSHIKQLKKSKKDFEQWKHDHIN